MEAAVNQAGGEFLELQMARNNFEVAARYAFTLEDAIQPEKADKTGLAFGKVNNVKNLGEANLEAFSGIIDPVNKVLPSAAIKAAHKEQNGRWN